MFESPVLVSYPEETDSLHASVTYSYTFSVTLFTITKKKKSILGAPQTEEWIKKTVYKMCVFTFLRANVYLYIKQTAMEIYSDFFEEGNPIICYSTYITGEHYSKWNKLTLEWQTLQDLVEIECWSEGTNVLLRWIISRALSYSVLTVTKKQHTTNMKSAQTAQRLVL